MISVACCNQIRSHFRGLFGRFVRRHSASGRTAHLSRLKLEVGLTVLIGGYPTTVLLAEIVLQALLLENGQIIETAIQSVSEKINLVSALGDCRPVNALTKTDTVETSYLQPDR